MQLLISTQERYYAKRILIVLLWQFPNSFIIKWFYIVLYSRYTLYCIYNVYVLLSLSTDFHLLKYTRCVRNQIFESLSILLLGEEVAGLIKENCCLSVLIREAILWYLAARLVNFSCLSNSNMPDPLQFSLKTSQKIPF